MYFFLFNDRYLYTNYLVPNQVFFLIQKAICSENILKLFPRPKWLIAKRPYWPYNATPKNFTTFIW